MKLKLLAFGFCLCFVPFLGMPDAVGIGESGFTLCYVEPDADSCPEHGALFPPDAYSPFIPTYAGAFVPHIDVADAVPQGGLLRVTVVYRISVEDMKVDIVDGDGVIRQRANGFRISEIEDQVVWICLTGIRSDLRPGKYDLVLSSSGDLGRLTCIGRLRIEEREFGSERIYLDKSLTELRMRPDPAKTAEARELWSVLVRFEPTSYYHIGGFLLPLDDIRLTAGFGDRRVYEYYDGKESVAIHNGIDIAAPVGTPVLACGDGRVVLAKDRIVTGNTAVIEHLPGVYSLYYHLSALHVEESDFVEKGTPIGAAGMSGLATGPHLHWEIRVSGVAVDPFLLAAEKVIDYDELFRIIETAGRSE